MAKRRVRGPNDEAWAEVMHATLANAVRAPFYRRTFGDAWKKVRHPRDLPRLPLLNKRTAIEHQRQLIVGRAPAGFGIASSGTTRTDVDLPPLNVLITKEEDEAIVQGLSDGGVPAPDPFPGWTLVVVAVNHGLATARPGHDELLVPWMHDANALYMMESVLSRPQPDGRRVTAMRVGSGALKTLTAWLLERGRDPSTFGVKAIGTTGFRLSPHWRALISEKFGATLVDNYSLSEFATPAPECPACGWLHFAWPPIIYEVLDVSTGAPLEDGAGRLVLTSVYPYTQKMPLIRYDTGDVVELGPWCRAESRRGFRFLGRVRRGLVVKSRQGGAFVCAPNAILDVLDGLPEVERVEHPCYTLGIIKCPDIGVPRWTTELRGKRAVLSFEVRFDPNVFERRARELEATVRRGVLAADASLRRLVRTKQLGFDVIAAPPQSLKPVNDKYA